MPFIPEPTSLQSSTIASLYIDALRQGQSLWFRVASNSMTPLFCKDDEVFITPTTAHTIAIGDIAAFETSRGLVIHRIICIIRPQRSADSLRLFQMSDVDLFPDWVEENAVVGRVITVQSQSRCLNINHPIAKWWGKLAARTRFLLYRYKNTTPVRMMLRLCSHGVVYTGYWYICRWCISKEVRNTNTQ